MKFTNVKQLIIKFMGGGLINFPTRFLRWVKINGDTDDSDDGSGGGSSSDIFFSPISVQPSYITGEDEIIDIKDATVDTLDDIGRGEFFYSKESLVSIGVNEQGLDNLEQVSYSDTFNESNISKGWNQIGLKDIIRDNLLSNIEVGSNSFTINKFTFSNRQRPVIFKIGDNIYRIAIFTEIG